MYINLRNLVFNTGNQIAPSNGNGHEITIQSLVERNKRVIIAHAQWQMLDDNDRRLTYEPVNQLWSPKSTSADHLFTFLGNQVCKSHSMYLQAAMGCITPSFESKHQ